MRSSSAPHTGIGMFIFMLIVLTLLAGDNPTDKLYQLLDTYPESLDETVERVTELEQAGATKKEIAVWVEEAVDRRLTNLNQPSEVIMSNSKWGIPWVYNRIHLRVNRYRIDNQEGFHSTYNKTAKYAWENRMGQCNENANLTYYILKKSGIGGNLRMQNAGDWHTYTVWGIADGADPNDPDTWGEDALVIDSWLGEVGGWQMADTGYYFGYNGEREIIDATQERDIDAVQWQVSEENQEASDKEEDPLEDCFIATAVYGSAREYQVQTLRTYRDTYLRKHISGRVFINTYETFAPPFAYWLKQNPEYKPWVRQQIVDPAAAFANRQMEEDEKH